MVPLIQMNVLIVEKIDYFMMPNVQRGSLFASIDLNAEEDGACKAPEITDAGGRAAALLQKAHSHQCQRGRQPHSPLHGAAIAES